MRSIEGRVVLVTGATAGIGRRTAERLADAGATVVGCARDELRLREVRGRRPDLDLRHCDVTDPDQRAALVAGVLADHGRIDVLVNNAGLGWEAAAVHRSVTRPWSRTASVPRWIGLGRALAVQPLRTAVDVAVGLNAGRAARLGRAAAERRTPQPAGTAAPVPES